MRCQFDPPSADSAKQTPGRLADARSCKAQNDVQVIERIELQFRKSWSRMALATAISCEGQILSSPPTVDRLNNRRSCPVVYITCESVGSIRKMKMRARATVVLSSRC